MSRKLWNIVVIALAIVVILVIAITTKDIW